MVRLVKQTDTRERGNKTMRQVTQKYSVYQFNELSDEAKDKARDNWRQYGLDYEWWDCVVDDAKTIGALMGIDIDEVYFSGFASQGDGAQFTGNYAYKRGSVAAVKEYAPQDKTLHEIAETLAQIQKRHFYSLSASVSSTGRYSHEYCTSIDVVDDRKAYYQDVSDDTEEELKDALRDYMRWIYSRLREERNWLNSDQMVSESLIANECEFTEDGEII